MPQNKKTIKLRMKSVRNTRKITKAMELVAASKMRRAISQTLKSRAYAKLAEETLREALAGMPSGIAHPLLAANPLARKTLCIVFSSDRGLAGGFHANLLRTFRDTFSQVPQESLDVIAVGRKGAEGVERMGRKLVAQFPALSQRPALADLLPVIRMATDGFSSGTYAKVVVLFTDFVSGVRQVPVVREVLPFLPPVSRDVEVREEKLLCEPSPEAVVRATLPALLETLMWQMLLESVASEHAARMLAMKNASDAASDMLSSLTFTYNQVRQGAITQEIAEISGGKSALEGEAA